MIAKDKKHLVFNKILDNPPALYLIPFTILSAVMAVLIISGYDFSAYSYYIIHYIYTYRHGYISRGFIGEVISWFADIVTPQITAAAVIIGSFLLIIAASLCIGFALNRVKKDKKLFWLVFWLIVVLCLSPFTFRNYLTAIKIDKFVWAVALFTMPLLAHKKAIWLVPPMCVLAIVINPIFLFTSMIIIAIPLLQKVFDENFSKKMVILCALTYVLIIAAGLASAISEKYIGFENSDEMVRFYFSRYRGANGTSEITDEMLTAFEDTLLIDYFLPFKQMIQVAIKMNLLEPQSIKNNLAHVVFFVVPVEALFITFWCLCIKNSKKGFQKLVFLACILSPLVAVLPATISGEISKYFSNNVFATMCIIIYFIASRNPAVLASVKRIKQSIKTNKAIYAFVVAYLMMLMTINV